MGVMGVKVNKKLEKFTEVWTVSLFLLFCCVSCAQGLRRFTSDSCSSLTPQQTSGVNNQENNFELYQQQSPPGGWRGVGGRAGDMTRGLKRIKRDGYDRPPPAILTVLGKRYRRDSDLYVQVEGRGYYDGLILQARVVGSDGNLLGGRVGLVGHFDLNRVDRRNFTYLECFHQPTATVVDGGMQRYGNVSFIWKAPEADKGNIRFAAGITQEHFHWVVVSKILEFNPFPISTVQCGAGDACFRVCSLDSNDGLCASHDALLMYQYNTDLLGRRDVEFTLGGRLSSPQSNYIAVVYAEDNDNLYQADVTACYFEHGRAQIAHFIMEVTGAPLLQHQEDISLDDYDYDGNMLWCRYRRPIGYTHSSYVTPWKSFYTLLYKGELDPPHYPKFLPPRRSDMYSSDQKLNLTTPINRYYSGSGVLLPSIQTIIFTLMLLIYECHQGEID